MNEYMIKIIEKLNLYTEIEYQDIDRIRVLLNQTKVLGDRVENTVKIAILIEDLASKSSELINQWAQEQLVSDVFMDFFYAERVKEDRVIFRSLLREEFFEVGFKEKIDIEEHDLIYGAGFRLKDTNEIYLDKNLYFILEDDEFDRVVDLQTIYSTDVGLYMLGYSTIIPRLISYNAILIDELFKAGFPYNIEELPYEMKINHVLMLFNISKAVILPEESVDIFTLDYRKYIKRQIELGHFFIDGELESYINFLINILSYGEDRATDAIEELKEIKLDIFNYKNMLRESTLVVLGEFTDDIYYYIEDTGFNYVPELYHGFITDLQSLYVTPKTRKVSAKGKRELARFMSGNYEFSKEDALIIDYIKSFLVSNKLAYYRDDMLLLTEANDYYYNLTEEVKIAYFLMSVLKKDVWKDYLSDRPSIKVDDLMIKLKSSIINNEFKNIKDMKGGSHLLESLDALGLVTYEGAFKLTDLGKIYQKHLINKKIPGKILRMNEYR